MKQVRILLPVLALLTAFSGQVHAAQTSKFKVQIVPMGCQFTVIDTGTNEIQYLTPATCTDTSPPPNNPPVVPEPLPEPLFAPDIPSVIEQILNDEQPDPPVSEPVVINLSEVQEFQQGINQYVSVPRGKRVEFDVRSESHSVTVKEIGVNYVVLTIASKPFDTRIYVGSQNQYDVTSDGIFDIEITLRGISGNTADLVFRSLAVVDPGQADSEVTSEAPVSSKSYAWLYVATLCILVAIGATALIIRRKRRMPLN